jgi:hypothetical protein
MIRRFIIMVRLDGNYELTSEGKVQCSLMADSIDEILDMGEGMEIKGLPEEYWDKLDMGCDAMDTEATLIFLQSDGTWKR